jgi:hypothetical protein
MRKDALAKRLDGIAKRAVVHRRGLVPILDLTEWPDDLQRQYLAASEADRDAMIEARFGPLPVGEPGSLDVLYVVVEPCPEPPEEREIDSTPEPVRVRARSAVEIAAEPDAEPIRSPITSRPPPGLRTPSSPASRSSGSYSVSIPDPFGLNGYREN